MLTGLEFLSSLIATYSKARESRKGEVEESQGGLKSGCKVPVRPGAFKIPQQPMRIVRGGNEFVRPLIRICANASLLRINGLPDISGVSALQSSRTWLTSYLSYSAISTVRLEPHPITQFCISGHHCDTAVKESLNVAIRSFRESRHAVPSSGKPIASPGSFPPCDGRLSFQTCHRFVAATDRRCSFPCVSLGASIPGSRLLSFASRFPSFVSPQVNLTPRSATMARHPQSASRCDPNSRVGHGPSPSRSHLREWDTEIGSPRVSERL